MAAFLIYVLKVGGWIAVFYLFYRLLLQKETFHRLNRIVLLSTATLAFILPFCIITFHENIEMAAPVAQATITVSTVSAVGSPSDSWWITVAIILYWSGFAFILGRMLLSICRVRCLIAESELLRQADGVRIAVIDKPISPSSWYKTIILSRKDYEENDVAILAHERGHITHLHTVDVILTDILTALQWFNPAIWMLRIDLRAIHEYQADLAVLSKGINARQYQYLLIRKATGNSGYSAASSFSHSTLKKRITMMSKSKSSDKKTYKALFILPIIALAFAMNARTVTNVTYLPENNMDELKHTIKGNTSQTAIGDTVAVQQTKQDSENIVGGVEVKSIDKLDVNTTDTTEYVNVQEASSIYLNESFLIKLNGNKQDEKNINLKGFVYGANGLPIVGAAIKVVGSNKEVVTSADGGFELSGLNPSDEIELSGFIMSIPGSGQVQITMTKENKTVSDKKATTATLAKKTVAPTEKDRKLPPNQLIFID